jgi:hypothetical protein
LVAGNSPQDIFVHVIGGFQYDFSEAKAAFCKPFKVQNHRSGLLRRVIGTVIEQLKLQQ